MSEKLDRFFDAFIKQAAVYTESTPCGCKVCVNADALGLKIIVHAGEAMFHEVAGRPQVSGPDVILAHRLLKNSVEGDEYLLLSQAAFDLMGDNIPGEFEAHEESYEGFSNVSVRVRHFRDKFLRERDKVYELPADEVQVVVDNYLEWGNSLLGKAAADQLRSPIREFPWWQKILTRVEVLLAGLAGRLHFRKAIAKSILERGRRRGLAHDN